jgi:hypothetical protein
VTRDLKVTRVFSTLVEEMKAIGIIAAGGGGGEASQCTDVMAPVAHSERSPVLLLMGGGMGAGKSTVLKELKQEAFWTNAEANAVVVEADAFKEADVIYRAISSMGHHNDMLQTAELVRNALHAGARWADSDSPFRLSMHSSGGALLIAKWAGLSTCLFPCRSTSRRRTRRRRCW